MTLKWLAVVVATVSLTLCATGNAVTLAVDGGELPLVAELHDRLNDRVSALTEFLVARLNEIETHTGDRNSGFVEGYLLSQGQEAAVVPFGRRGRGAAER